MLTEFLKSYRNFETVNGIKGVSVYVVSDELGDNLDRICKELWLIHKKYDGIDEEDFLKWAKWIRWMRAHGWVSSESQIPNAEVYAEFKAFLAEESEVGDEPELLAELEMIAEHTFNGEPSPMLVELIDTISVLGHTNCLVVASSRLTRNALKEYLGPDVLVLTLAEARTQSSNGKTVIAFGFPQSFPSALWSSPLSGELIYIVPSWLKNKDVPNTPMKDVAELSLRIDPYFDWPEGEKGHSEEKSGNCIDSIKVEEAVLNPTSRWTGDLRHDSASPLPSLGTFEPDKMPAVRLHLSGGWTFWMPMNESHRGVDLSFPVGQRIQYLSARELTTSDLLFFRIGESETEELDRLTIEELGTDFLEVQKRQEEWKAKLRANLRRMGPRLVARELRTMGIKTAERVENWAEDSLIKPVSDVDFEKLLVWLDCEVDSHFSAARRLRSARSVAAWKVRRSVERLIDVTVMDDLSEVGFQILGSNKNEVGIAVVSELTGIHYITVPIDRSDSKRAVREGADQWLI